MEAAAAVVMGYGLFCLVGGIIGYVKAKSRASLIAGAISGAALVLFGALMLQGSRAAGIGTLIVALSLGGRFLGTWRRQHRVMPDLVMVLGAAAAFIAAGLVLAGR